MPWGDSTRSERASKRTETALRALVAAFLLLSACPADAPPRPTPGPSQTPPTVGRVFVFGVLGEPAAMDPDSLLASDLTHALAGLRGPYRVASRTPGLEVAYERDPDYGGARPRMRRFVVRFVQTTELLLELLRRKELDAAAIPATVNLTQRLDEMGLHSVAAFGSELVYLDLRGVVDRDMRAGLATGMDSRSLQAAYIRDLGRPARNGQRRPGSGGAEGTIQLAAPHGDELLALLQRALHDDWESAGFTVDVVTIDARTFYGSWAEEPQVEVALRRGSAEGLPSDAAALRALEAVPLFEMQTVIAYRDGVHGIEPVRGPRRLFADAEGWFLSR